MVYWDFKVSTKIPPLETKSFIVITYFPDTSSLGFHCFLSWKRLFFIINGSYSSLKLNLKNIFYISNKVESLFTRKQYFTLKVLKNVRYSPRARNWIVESRYSCTSRVIPVYQTHFKLSIFDIKALFTPWILQKRIMRIILDDMFY